MQPVQPEHLPHITYTLTSTTGHTFQIKTLKLTWYNVATIHTTTIETSWETNVNCLICHQKSRLLRWEDRHSSTSAPVDKTVSHTSYRFFVAEGIDALLFYVFIPVDKTKIVIALFFVIDGWESVISRPR